MNQYADNLMESDLQELLANQPAPDLTARALEKLRAGARGANETLARRAGESAQATIAVDVETEADPAPRLATWRRYAQAAAILLVLGMVGWLLTRPDTLPAGVLAGEGTDYRVRADHIELKSGWVLLSDGAPVLVVGVGRVENVNGRAVAGTGIPGEDALDSLADQLQLSAKERNAMKNPKRWITAGMLALCVLSGQALFNGQVVIAEEESPTPDRLEMPKPEDGAAVRALFDHLVSFELRVLSQARYSGWVHVDDAEQVRAVAAAFRGNLKDQSAAPAGWIHPNEFELRLKDGQIIEASVHEGTSTSPGTMCDLRLPGWKRYHQFDCSPELARSLRTHLDTARKAQRLPANDAKAMRALLSRAVSATFDDSTEVSRPVSGTINDPAVLARFSGLLWPDDMGFSKTHIADRDVYRLTLKLNDGTSVEFVVGNTGIFSLAMAGETSVEGRILPESSMKALHELFLGHATAAPFAVQREWTGADSKITKARNVMITDSAAWHTLWVDHAYGPPKDNELIDYDVPEVDFARNVVLGVFAGTSWNSRGFFVHELLQGTWRYTVRVDERTYQTAGPDGGGVRCTPFGIFVLPRTDAAITVEENVQGMIGEPAIWQALEANWKPKSDINPMLEYAIDGARKGIGGEANSQFLVARNRDEWSKLHDDVGAGVDKLPYVDWDKYVAVAATGTVLKGLGNFELTLAGRNSGRTVLRLSQPVAQARAGAEYESIWRIWLIPKPDREIIVETRVYGMIGDPETWKETHTLKP